MKNPRRGTAGAAERSISPGEEWRSFKYSDAAGPLIFGPCITAVFWSSSTPTRLLGLAGAQFAITIVFVIVIASRGRTESDRCDPLHEAWAAEGALFISATPWVIDPDPGAYLALALVVTFALGLDTLYMSLRHSRWWGSFVVVEVLSFAVFFAVHRSWVLAICVIAFGVHMFDGQRGIRTVLASLRAARNHSDRIAETDYLTGLNNRRGLAYHLAELANHGETVMHCAVIDVDNFKHINDQFGHAEGDRTLIKLGARIQLLLGSEWRVARTGGDEFMAVSATGSLKEIEYLQEALTTPDAENGVRGISTSVGVAYGRLSDDVWNDALAAVRVAKRRGKAQVVAVGSALRDQMRRERNLVSALPEALADQKIKIWAQPIVDTTTGDVYAYECLARWILEDGSIVNPATFVPLVEEQGLSMQLGELVITQAAKFAALLPAGIKVTVNVSASHFQSGNLVDLLDRVVAITDIDPRSMVIEITESQHLQNEHARTTTAEAVRSRGFGLAVDDFGSGYSSMERLIELPFSHLKIDMVLVQACTDSATKHLLDGIAHFAKKAEVIVIAEGVETEEQAAVLQALGISLIQGYLLARPAPLEEIVRADQPSRSGSA